LFSEKLEVVLLRTGAKKLQVFVRHNRFVELCNREAVLLCSGNEVSKSKVNVGWPHFSRYELQKWGYKPQIWC